MNPKRSGIGPGDTRIVEAGSDALCHFVHEDLPCL